MNTGTRIRMLRTVKGLTQNALAERSGIAVNYISTIESDAISRYEQRLLETLGYTPTMDALLDQLAGNGHSGAAVVSV